MSGTVNIARSLWADPTFKNSEMSQREAWIWMISEASWKPRTKRIGIYEVALQRSQFAASTRFMATVWMWKEPRVRRYLDMLEKRRMISRATDAGLSVITICKYNDYQYPASAGDATTTQRPTQNRRTTDANHNKGEIREIKIGGGSARAPEAEILRPENPPFRDRILAAIGVDPCGLTDHGSRMMGTQADMAHAAQWLVLPGITEDAAIAEIEAIMQGKRDGPPSTLAYFNKAMSRLSGALNATALQPTLPTGTRGRRHDSTSFDIAHREYARRLAAGEIDRGPDPSDPFAGR